MGESENGATSMISMGQMMMHPGFWGAPFSNTPISSYFIKLKSVHGFAQKTARNQMCFLHPNIVWRFPVFLSFNQVRDKQVYKLTKVRVFNCCTRSHKSESVGWRFQLYIWISELGTMNPNDQFFWSPLGGSTTTVRWNLMTRRS